MEITLGHLENIGRHGKEDKMKGKETRRCSRCKIEKSFSKFQKHPTGKYGYNAKCKKCLAKYRKEHEQIPEIKKARIDYQYQYNRTLNRRYGMLKLEAKSRKLDCTLTIEEYSVSISSNKCHYCGNKLNETGSGLDRINNCKGYILNNVVSCCYRCNIVKGNHFTYKEMLELKPILTRIRLRRGEK